MKRLKSYYGVMSLLLAAASSTGVAQAAEPDARVAKALKAAKIKYEAGSDLNFYIQVPTLPKGRRQVVVVLSATRRYRNALWRPVRSEAFEVKGELTQQQANELLKNSGQHPVGAWSSYVVDGKTFVYFVAMVRANASAVELESVVRHVGASADAMELRILGSDEN